MALKLAKFDGGATRAKVADVLGFTKQSFRQFVVWADPGNSGSVFFGPSTVTGVPVDETLKLLADKSVNFGPQDSQRPFIVDTDALYVVGSAASQVCWFLVNTDDSV